MLNPFLDDRTRRDIDQKITKVLRDLGDPEPPLRMEIVHELLKLDLAYYSSNDQGILRETFHRLRVGSKQVLQRPTLLLDAIRKLDLKALWVPDRKRILIDSQLPPAKHRWVQAHEVTHSLVPYHNLMLHGDQQQTLTPLCEERLEAEANYGAGRLLFLQDLFREHFLSGPQTMEEVLRLAKKVFHNSITSTLWRAVETFDTPAFGLVITLPNKMNGLDQPRIRYFV